MPPKTSAGILLYRVVDGDVEVLLVHPGGPFWATRDREAWSIPKGEYEEGEESKACAAREFEEELGMPLPVSLEELVELGEVRQRGGKLVTAWAAAGDFDPANLRSNTFEIEWPPRSGKTAEFPEVDRAAWFSPEAAREKLNPAQVTLVERLLAYLNGRS